MHVTAETLQQFLPGWGEPQPICFLCIFAKGAYHFHIRSHHFLLN